MSIISSWLMVLLSSSVSFLIFCLLDLFLRGVLKSPTRRMDFSVSPHSPITFCLRSFLLCVRCVHIRDCYVTSEN